MVNQLLFNLLPLNQRGGIGDLLQLGIRVSSGVGLGDALRPVLLQTPV
jgi:hypothetical protein